VQAELSLWEMRQSQCEVEAADAGCQQLDLKTAAVRRRVAWCSLGFDGESRFLALSPEVVVVVIE
jgi:hypothetical protein